jgi:hypothetical protein
MTLPTEKDRAGVASPLGTFMVWLMGIVGGIAAFLGVFILVAGDDQYVGIGGDLSWRVGDIAAGWAYGLLIGGAVLLLISLGTLIVTRRSHRSAQPAGDALSSLVWHALIFTVVNAFIWFQDIVLGDGLNYAYWITIPWAVGLGIHAVTVLFARSNETPTVESSSERTVREKDDSELQPH